MKTQKFSKYRKELNFQNFFTEWQVENVSGNQLRVIIWEERLPLQKLARLEAILSEKKLGGNQMILCDHEASLEVVCAKVGQQITFKLSNFGVQTDHSSSIYKCFSEKNIEKDWTTNEIKCVTAQSLFL